LQISFPLLMVLRESLRSVCLRAEEDKVEKGGNAAEVEVEAESAPTMEGSKTNTLYREPDEEKAKQAAAARKKPTATDIENAISEIASQIAQIRALKWGDESTGQVLASRASELEQEIKALWASNKRRIREGVPRYVDGLPARDVVRPPRVTLPQPVWRRETGLAACVQCEAKGLRCSRTRALGGEAVVDPEEQMASPIEKTTAPGEYRKLAGPRCQRCVRNGEPCLVWSGGEGRDEVVAAAYRDMPAEELGPEEELYERLERLYSYWKGVQRNERMEIIGSRMERLRLDNFALPMRRRSRGRQEDE
jgi:hypothetical protein